MRRLSLLSAAVLVSLMAFAAVAQAAPFAFSADVGASIAGSPGDIDGDGIPDEDDQCPGDPGPAAAHGCPDPDGDGLNFYDDDCPNQPGPAATRGCPDADGDGIVDSDDKCPSQPGGYPDGGCPNYDADYDGFVDSADACPNVPVPDSTDGCPTWYVNGNGILKDGWTIYGRCYDGDSHCKPVGTASLTLTKSAKRDLDVESAFVGRWAFEKPCGGGVFCAYIKLGDKLKKRVKHFGDGYVKARLTVKMTEPQKSTNSKVIKLGVGANAGGLYRLDSPNSPAGCHCN